MLPIGGKKLVGAITKDAPDPLPHGVFKIDVRMLCTKRSAENIWSGKSLELGTLSTALPAVLKVSAVTSSDEARRDFIKEQAATQYADFCVELQNLEHQCSKGDVMKISAEPILVSLFST